MEKIGAVLRFIGRSAWRIGVLVVGGALLLAGLVMMVTPGPGLLLILAGLVVLATEFAWAERLLERAVRRLEAAKRAATQATPLQRALGSVVLVLAAAATLAAVVIWDIPFLPV